MAITPLPTPPDRSVPSDFSTKADALLGALPLFVTEANAQAVALTLNATTDASTTSNAIATGAKTFTVTTGKSFQPGMWLVIADTAAPSTNAMYGIITSYSGTTLVMNIKSIIGGGTKTGWTISQSAIGGLLINASNLAIGSDADGDEYYRSGGVLTRLPKGAANLEQFMNAAGTAPEWAEGNKSGFISRDLNAAGGNVSYTGIGFKPSLIFGTGIWGNSFCYWQNDGTSDMEMVIYGTTPIYYGATDAGIYFMNAAGNQATTAKWASFDIDGFTLTWGGNQQVGLGTFAYTVLR